MLYTLVYLSTENLIPETRNLHSHCCENPKFHTIHISTALQINMLYSAKFHNNYE